jgi:archaeal flagellar protein FlaJ
MSALTKIFSNKKFLTILIISVLVAVMIFIIDFLIFFSDLQIFSSIAIIAILTSMFPIMLFLYSGYSKKREVEEMFPIFLRDFVESLRGGMTLPQAFKVLRKNNYKALTPHIQKIAAQLDWGITVEKSLTNFSKETESKLIGRIISSVIESHKFGGNFADTFEALSSTSLEVDKLRQERRIYLQSQLMTGYIIFFVFLAVIIGLGKFLVPSLSEISTSGLGTTIEQTTSPTDLANEYKIIFRNLILLQGLFAGLTVGKMSEGSTVSGIKHSIFMMVIGIVVFTIFG